MGKKFLGGFLALLLAFNVNGLLMYSALAVDLQDQITPENVSLTLEQDGHTIPDDGSGSITVGRDFTISLEFDLPQTVSEQGTTLDVNLGDYADFAIPGFEITPTSGIALTTEDGTVIAHAELISSGVAGADNDIRVVFDNADVFNDQSGVYGAHCTLEATMNYIGQSEEDLTGNETVTLLDKTFKLEPRETSYSLEKSGTVLNDGTTGKYYVLWTVTAHATKENDAGSEDQASLAGLTFTDDLSGVGGYIEDSFQVGSSEGTLAPVTPSNDGNLSYTFGDVMSPQVIQFKTSTADDFLINGSDVTNTAKLINPNDNNKELASGTGTAPYTPPTLITKSGASNETNVGGNYTKPNTVTWTIQVGAAGVTLHDIYIVDPISSSSGMTYQSAAWTGGGIGDITFGALEPSDATYGSGTYYIGTITGQGTLTIAADITNLPAVILDKSHQYSNSAKLYSSDFTGYKTADNYVTVGYPGFTKNGTADVKTGTITWDVALNPEGQTMNSIKLYDLFVYGDSFDATGVTSDPALPTGVNLGSLTQNLHQKYVDGTFAITTGDTSGVASNVYTLKKDGTAVADLLEITVPDNQDRTYTFHTEVTDPTIYAANKSSSYTIPNTVDLTYNNGTDDVTGHAIGSAVYSSNTLLKKALKWGAGSTGTYDPTQIAQNLSQAFNYTDKSVVYRLLVNQNGMQLTDSAANGGKGLSNFTLTDTLPGGWEFQTFDGGANLLLYRMDGGSLVPVTDSTEISNVLDLNGSTFDNGVASIRFSSLNETYVILLKAGMTDPSGFFSTNQSQTYTNSAALTYGDDTQLSNSQQDVKVTSKILNKSYIDTDVSNGYLTWKVDYNPYGYQENKTAKIQDTLPAGLELHTDAMGALLLGDGNVTAYKLTMSGNDSPTQGDPVGLTLGENIFYDNTNRILTFAIPDSNQAYRLTYVTDITAKGGADLNNTATLVIGDVTSDVSGTGSYAVNSNYRASATLLRGGTLTVSKVDGALTPLPGAQFTLFAQDGSTVIRRGSTDSEGVLSFWAIPVGSYSLRETVAPDGYSLTDRVYSVTVSQTDSQITTSVDGGSNQLTVTDYPSATTGSLTISKMVTGNAADLTKAFHFALTLADGTSGDALTGIYEYFGTGISAGTIENGSADLDLANGQSVTILGLPAGTTYTVTEDSYTGDGYVTQHSIDNGAVAGGTTATGVITASNTNVAAFTNTKNVYDSDEPVTPTTPTVPTTPTTPTTPATPEYPISKVPDPNDPNSPDDIVVIGDDGTPLGEYHKEKEPDGDYVYVDDGGVPLGALDIPTTGDGGLLMLWSLGTVGSLAGIVWLMWPRTRVKPE